jgi:hypothetical protein
MSILLTVLLIVLAFVAIIFTFTTLPRLVGYLAYCMSILFIR